MIALADRWREVTLSLSRHRLRSALTAFGVFWGVFMFALLLGIGKGFERGVFAIFKDDAFNSVWIYGGETSMPYAGLTPGRSIVLTIDDLSALKRALTDVGHATPREALETEQAVTTGRKSGAFEILGIYPGYHVIEHTIPQQGRLLNPLDVRGARSVAVIGARVAELLFGANADPVGRRINIVGASYLIVGVFNDSGGESEVRRIYIPYSALQRSFDPSRKVGLICFTAAKGSAPRLLEARIRRVLASRHQFNPNDNAAVSVYNFLEEYQKFEALFAGINLFVGVVGAGTLFAGLVGVGNIMLISVRERTREIGIRKALGATPGAILIMVLGEALLITAAAGYAGLVMGVGLVELVRVAGFEAAYFRAPEVELTVALGATAALIVGGVIAGYIPARQAARINPIEALRHE